MKRCIWSLLFIFAVFWLLCCLHASAQTVNLTGTLQNVDGTPFNGTLYISLARSTVVNTCVTPVQIVPFQPITIAVTNGTVATTPIFTTDCIQPRIPYDVQLRDLAKTVVWEDNWYIPANPSGQAVVSTMSDEKLEPGIVVAIPDGILSAPLSTQTITQPGSTVLKVNRLSVTGTLTFSGTLPGDITGNAATMTAWQNTPVQCPAGFYLFGIDAAGDAACNNRVPSNQTDFTSMYLPGEITTYKQAGMYVNWNITQGLGETDFVANSSGAGLGGFNWFQGFDNGFGFSLMSLDTTGQLILPHGLANAKFAKQFNTTPPVCDAGVEMQGITRAGAANCSVFAPYKQSVSTTNICTTGNNSYDTCVGTVTFPLAFADATYAVLCQGVGPSDPRAMLQGATALTNQTAQFQIATEGSVGITYSKINCVGVAASGGGGTGSGGTGGGGSGGGGGGGGPAPCTGTGCAGGRIPNNAQTSGILDGSSKWEWNHDAGTPGSSSGSTTYPNASPSKNGASRFFTDTFSGGGGEIWHISWGLNAVPTHYVYDLWIYVVDPPLLQNLELDMNHVIKINGVSNTIILATQCASGSGTWEYTKKTDRDHWFPSNLPCKTTTWVPNTWHHIQIATHHNSVGVVTWDWIGFDGVYSNFASNITGTAGGPLGWTLNDELINFQLDGKTSGSISLYGNLIQVWFW
jgi:hypothetical protein